MGHVNNLRFDGKVVIVTGAGGGLGKQYALLFSDRGAAVVVNDLGVAKDGEGSSSNAADEVVNQILKAGGKAVANYDSVENGEKILQTALDSFGRIDVIINNAGILRDRTFVRISDQDWDLVHRVHLRGAFILTRAAWPHFKKQNFGRIIMTSSVAGIYGNFGQANYSAAKLGLIGLSNTLAIEGAKYNIHCNVVVPMAASRLTQGLMPPDLFEELRPEYVAPVVAWLCHEDCTDNGGIFEAAGGWVGKYQWQRSRGVMLRQPGKSFTPEMVKDSWDAITDMQNYVNLLSTEEAVGTLMEAMSEKNNVSSSQLKASKVAGTSFNVDHANSKFPPVTYSYTNKDVILYALSVGVSTSDADHLKYLYENSADFSPLPTFAVIPAQAVLMSSGIFSGGIPGLDVNLTQLLHGEQYVEVLAPLLPEDKLECQASIVDVLDKGSGALVIIDVNGVRNKLPVIRAQFALFFVGSGGFGGKRASEKAVSTADAPSRPPDRVVDFPISINQAALYRLNGDINPMHIDPDFAAVAGFSRPILHGLCTYGIAAREVLKQFAGNDPTQFRAMKARFIKPAFPGQTLRIEMWQEGKRVHVICKAHETGETLLAGGFVDLLSVGTIDKLQEKTIQKPAASVSDNLFTLLTEKVQQVPEMCKTINAVFLWNILKNGKLFAQWTLDLRAGKGVVHKGEPSDTKPQCTMTIDEIDLVQLAEGKLDPQKAFMSGKLKLSGNIMLTRKLQPLFKSMSKL